MSEMVPRDNNSPVRFEVVVVIPSDCEVGDLLDVEMCNDDGAVGRIEVDVPGGAKAGAPFPIEFTTDPEVSLRGMRVTGVRVAARMYLADALAVLKGDIGSPGQRLITVRASPSKGEALNNINYIKKMDSIMYEHLRSFSNPLMCDFVRFFREFEYQLDAIDMYNLETTYPREFRLQVALGRYTM